jgi:hypothetical protein
VTPGSWSLVVGVDDRHQALGPMLLGGKPLSRSPASWRCSPRPAGRPGGVNTFGGDQSWSSTRGVPGVLAAAVAIG